MFFENTHQVPRETAGSQDAIAKLDLNYYVPCRAQQRTVAVLGLGKTDKGDFLSSEDIELARNLGRIPRHRDSERPALRFVADRKWRSTNG